MVVVAITRFSFHQALCSEACSSVTALSINAQGKRRRVEPVEGGRIITEIEMQADASSIIDTLVERAKDLGQRLALCEAKQNIADAEVEVRLAEKILEMQRVAQTDEMRVPAGGDEAGLVVIMAADYNAKLAFKEAEYNAKSAALQLQLCRDREVIEKRYACRNKLLDKGVSMHKEQMERTMKFADELDSEVKKRVRKVRDNYEKRLRDALKPKTSVDVQLGELKKQLDDERVRSANLRQELEFVKQTLRDVDNASGEEEEEADDDDDDYDDEEELNVHDHRGGVGKDRSAEIEHLKLCFSNAAKMRDNACIAREEMRIKHEALEKETEEKQSEAKQEIDRLTREVVLGFFYFSNNVMLIVVYCSSKTSLNCSGTRGLCAGARRKGKYFTRMARC